MKGNISAKRVRWIIMILTAVLLLSIAWITAEPSYAAETTTYTQDGLTYKLDPETKEAQFSDIDSSITDVVIPSAVTAEDGTEYTVTSVVMNHSYYKNVTSIRFPNTVKKICRLELPNVTSLEIPEGVESLSSLHFSGITSLVIPDTVKEISNVQMENVTELKLSNSLESVTGYFRFKSLKELTIPGSVKKFDGYLAFNSSLEKLVFEEGVEEIGRGFSNLSGCDNLKEIVLPSSLKKIQQGASFSGAAVESLTLPEGLEIDGDSADNMFSKMENLKSIDLPAGMTPNGKISYAMFRKCSSLESITVHVPLTEIGKYAFSECTSLKEVPDLSNVTSMGARAFYKTYSLTGTIDLSSLTEIPEYAFTYSGSDSDEALNVKFSSDLKSIGNWAFAGANLGLEDGALKLDNVESIGNYAFNNDQSIKSVELGDSLKTLGNGAFSNCTGLESLKIGDGITTIKAGIFKNCTSLKTIEIGSGIEEIADDAFADSNSLESVTIHSAPDEVSVTSVGNIPKSEIHFTLASSEGEDETYTANSEETLQDAVNRAAASENGGVVELEKNVKLKNTLIIPEGNKVTIRSKDGGEYRIWVDANDDHTDGALIRVEKNQTLTLDHITIRGKGVTIADHSGLIDVDGTLVLNEGAVVRDAKLSENCSGVINLGGSGAKLVMNEGSSIENNALVSGATCQQCGTVRVDSGAEFEMYGGSIQNNEALDDTGSTEWKYAGPAFCSAGVYLAGGTMKMNGGSISNNHGHAGTAVTVTNKSVFEVSGDALIEGNRSTVNNARQHYANDDTSYGTAHVNTVSGAVLVENGGTMKMTGGTFKGNSSAQCGGAIAVANGGTLTMDGGTITENHAGNAGGGIYSYSDETTLNAGSITNNTAYLGGGVYSEGNTAGYSTVTLNNVLIEGNSASRLGGGIWTCPTGRLTVGDNGAAIFGNTAGSGSETAAAGDDLALLSQDQTIQKTHDVSNRMLGGGKVSYAQDGSTASNPSYQYGMILGHDRYDPENPKEVTVHNANGRTGYTLKSIVDQEGTKTLARSKAKLIISGNSATLGGGVGANGGIYIPGSGSKKIHIQKIWSQEPTGDDAPTSIVVTIYAGGYPIENVTLSEENDWSADLTNLPDDLDASSITAKEVTNVAGYTASVSVSQSEEDAAQINVTVTNTPTPHEETNPTYTSMTVYKYWADNNGSGRPESIQVQLYRDGEAYGDPVTLNEDNNWSYMWDQLEEGYLWTVDEVEVPEGYTKTVINEETTCTITNTVTPSTDTPDEPDEPDTPSTPDQPHKSNPPSVHKTTENPTNPANPANPVRSIAPRTGDSSELFVWLGIAVAAVLGMFAVVLGRRHRSRAR